jgi:hypothetical protein
MVASDYILAKDEIDFAISCLQQAVTANPSNAKSKYLARLMMSNIALGRTVLLGWRTAVNGRNKLNALLKRGPKPVPAELLPS